MFGIIWLILAKLLYKQSDKQIIEQAEIEQKYHALGKITPDEKRTAYIFLLAVFLWLTGNNLQITDSFTIKGWREIFGLSEFKDASVAIFCALLLFIVPSHQSKHKTPVLEWSDTRKIPWGILLLFGGGFAIAGGFSHSGLSGLIAHLFTGIQSLSTLFVVLIISFVITFVTEITSNTAITTLTMPILAGVAAVSKIDPLLLMFPATISASCAFMMPTATPPQAIVYSSGYIPIRTMNKTGLVVNLIAAIIITLYSCLTI
jgi:sodium-dependent dicarboxylate transporter 2/3/5